MGTFWCVNFGRAHGCCAMQLIMGVVQTHIPKTCAHAFEESVEPLWAASEEIVCNHAMVSKSGSD